MRCAFLGSPDAAVPTLRALVDAGHEVELVISRDDARRDRRGRLSPTPVKACALELGLTVSSDLASLAGSDAEAAIVVAFGRIIPPSLLAVMPMLNVHFSLLPRWRGAAPVERAILAGDDRTGVCVMELEAALDTGPVLSRSEVLIGDKHAGELTAELAGRGASLLVATIGTTPWPSPTAQVGEPTYARRLDASDFALVPTASAAQLSRVVRLDRASATIGDVPVRVRRAHARGGDGQAGTVSVTGDQIALVCAEGHLVLDDVTASGSAPMSALAWWRGARLGPHVTWTGPATRRS